MTSSHDRPYVRPTVCPSVRPTVRPSVRSSVRASVRPFGTPTTWPDIEAFFLCFVIAELNFKGPVDTFWKKSCDALSQKWGCASSWLIPSAIFLYNLPMSDIQAARMAILDVLNAFQASRKALLRFLTESLRRLRRFCELQGRQDR